MSFILGASVILGSTGVVEFGWRSKVVRFRPARSMRKDVEFERSVVGLVEH